MRLVEIAGHLIDPGKVSYVGPIRFDDLVPPPKRAYAQAAQWFFEVCACGTTAWYFQYASTARSAQDSLIAAIESAQPEMTELEAAGCFPWRKSWPRIKMTDADIAEAQKLMAEHMGASDVLAEAQRADALAAGIQWPNISCADRCIVPTCRDDPGCPKGTKICPDLELPSSRGFNGGKG